MKTLIAVLMLAAAPLAAQIDDGRDPGMTRPPALPVARLRLAAMFPRRVHETAHPQASDPKARLMNYLQDSAPVLKNLHGLARYLHEGLHDPFGIGDPHPQWDEGWRLLGADLDALKPLAAEGDAIAHFPEIPGQTRFSPAKKREFPPLFAPSDVERDPRYTAQKKQLNEALIRMEAAFDWRESVIDASLRGDQGGARERAEAVEKASP